MVSLRTSNIFFKKVALFAYVLSEDGEAGVLYSLYSENTTIVVYTLEIPENYKISKAFYS